MLFKEMDISPKIIRALEDNQIASPTEIQEKSIPHGLSLRKSHVIGQAKTGSGKTLAFAIPIIEKIDLKNRHIQAVILVPTRELCKQNASVFRSITTYKKVKIVEVYGGASIRLQIEQIKNGGQVLVATPGRLIDLVRQGEVNFKCVNFVALDEADRMLDMGFFPDIRFLLLDAMRNVSPRLFLFSATLLEEIKKLIYKFTKNDTVHEIDVSKDSLTVENCDQYAYYVDKNKFWNFVKILNNELPEFSIIFTKTKRKTQELCRRLNAELGLNFNLKAGFIHGDLTQAKREETVAKFRNHKLNCLVATNVLARGLDFPKVSHVFNYDMPRDPEDYIHRIGRTARTAGIEKNVDNGKAISIVAMNQRELMFKIERLLKYDIERRSVDDPTNKVVLPKVERIETPEWFKTPDTKSPANKAKSDRRKNRNGSKPRRNNSRSSDAPKRNDFSKRSGSPRRNGAPKRNNRSNRSDSSKPQDASKRNESPSQPSSPKVSDVPKQNTSPKRSDSPKLSEGPKGSSSPKRSTSSKSKDGPKRNGSTNLAKSKRRKNRNGNKKKYSSKNRQKIEIL